MSQEFKLRFDQLKENDLTKQNTGSNNGEYHDNYGHARNLCFIWPNNKRLFLNYAYLVSGEYLPDESKIVLVFTSHSVELIGSNLEGLHNDLMDHQPRRILCIDERYRKLIDDKNPTIESIEVFVLGIK